MDDSPKSLVTRIISTPVRLIMPAKTVSPTFTERGIDSPVKAEVSTCELPSKISPSSGIFSPGLTKIRSPTLTSSGETIFTEPFTFRLALSGRTAKSALIERRERLTEYS